MLENSYKRGMFFTVLDWARFPIQIEDASPELTGVHLGGEPGAWYFYLGIGNRHDVTEEELSLLQSEGIISHNELFDLDFSDGLVGDLADAIL